MFDININKNYNQVMEYLVFDIKTEQHLKNVKDSLVNMAPEFNSQTNILICVEDESLFLDVRSVREFLVPGSYGEILITFTENFVDEVKENILGANGDIIFIKPDHVLGYGAYKKFLLDSMVYKYGLIQGREMIKMICRCAFNDSSLTDAESICIMETCLDPQLDNILLEVNYNACW